jgi:hypothetical protein
MASRLRLPQKLQWLMEAVRAKEESRYAIEHYYVKAGCLWATDGRQALIVTLPKELEDGQYYLYRGELIAPKDGESGRFPNVNAVVPKSDAINKSVELWMDSDVFMSVLLQEHVRLNVLRFYRTIKIMQNMSIKWSLDIPQQKDAPYIFTGTYKDTDKQEWPIQLVFMPFSEQKE